MQILPVCAKIKLIDRILLRLPLVFALEILPRLANVPNKKMSDQCVVMFKYRVSDGPRAALG